MFNKNILILKIKESYLVGDVENMSETDKIKASLYAQMMAEVIADGIESYLKEIELDLENNKLK